MRGKRLLPYGALAAILVIGGAGWMLSRPPGNIPSHSVHQSLYSRPDIFDAAYAETGNFIPPAEAPTGVLVNHHLLAASYIAEAFRGVATSAPITVLLISPNHFSSGSGPVLVSAKAFETPYGDVLPDNRTIQKLAEKSLVRIEDQPFDGEHGISSITPFVKKSLPNARLVPVIVNDLLSQDRAREIAGSIAGDLPENTIIVGSFDFSHYLTVRAADFHDSMAKEAIANFDFSVLPRLDVDSRPGVALFLQLLKLRGEQSFFELRHNNSGRLSGQLGALETTSYITGWFFRGVTEKSAPADTLLVLGTLNPAASVLQKFDRSGGQFALEYLERLLQGQRRTAVWSEKPVQDSVFRRFGITDHASSGSSLNLGGLTMEFVDVKGLQDPGGILRKAAERGPDIIVGNSLLPKLELYQGTMIVYGQGDFMTEMSVLKDVSSSLSIGWSYDGTTLTATLLPIVFEKGKGKLLAGEAARAALKEIAARSIVPDTMRAEIAEGFVSLARPLQNNLNQKH